VRLTVLTPQSTIHILGWDRDSIVVSGTITPEDRLGGGVMLHGTGAKFYLESSAEVGRDPEELEVRVPRRSRVWVRAGTAAVDVAGVAGGLDLNIVAGRIRVTGRPSELNAEAMDGDVDVTEPIAWLRARTAGGMITLRGGGEDVGLATVSGRIVVAGGTFSRGRFETVTGDIDFDGVVGRDGALTFDSHSGTVVLRMSPTLPASYDIDSIRGDITNELTGARPAYATDRRSRELGFTTDGDGPQAQITVRTFKGAIVLRRK
jgi:hypothetical protein